MSTMKQPSETYFSVSKTDRFAAEHERLENERKTNTVLPARRPRRNAHTRIR